MAAPSVVDLSIGGGTLIGGPGAGGSPGSGRPGGSARGLTEQAGSLVGGEVDRSSPDPQVRARAHQIAARLSLPRPRNEREARRGTGELASVPYRDGSAELDLDRTVELLAERRLADDHELVVRDRLRRRRAVALVVDCSGSMRGERIATMAAAVGALVGRLVHDDLAVIAFWSDAAILLRPGQPVRPLEVVDRLLRLPAEGLTNIAFPLELAHRELNRVSSRNRRVVLLSDCVHNAGPDPRTVAARLPRLDVLIDVAGEQNRELGRDLARAGRGRAVPVRTHRDVAPGLTRIFAR